jgi:cell division protein FtsN
MKTIVLMILVAALATACASNRKMYAAPFEEQDMVLVVEDRAPVNATVPTPLPASTAQAPAAERPIRVQQERVTVRHGSTNNRYHVIVGSFASEENALRLRNRLNNAGYASIIMLNAANMNRVSIAGFNDEFAAREELRRVRMTFPEYQDAWLLIMQPY